MNAPASQPKKRLQRELIAKSKWAAFYKDRVESNGGYDLEYWCVERSDSVIVVTVQNGRFVLPDPQYRPGINEVTLDFVGGRRDDADPLSAAAQAVRREFGLDEELPITVTELLSKPLIVDSAFSSQRVYGYACEIPADAKIDAETYDAETLLSELQCLQCRAMLLEWLKQRA